MADISITTTNVVKDSNASLTTGIAGETITAGTPVYLDVSTTPNKYKLADANDSQKYAAVGIALHGAAVNQPLTIQTAGDITIGGTVTTGRIYMTSTNAGGIAPTSDNTTGNYTCILGIALSATLLRINIQTADVAYA